MATTYGEQQLAPEVSASLAGFADPVPLGLLGYGMTTVLLSLANAAVYPAGSMVLAMAVFFGGIAQVIVAVMAYRNNNTFAVTAFAGYGFLWITLAFLTIGADHGWAGPNSGTAMGFYLLMWAIFTFGLMVGSSVAPRVLTGVLALTVILLLVLAIANWADSTTITKIGGWEGVLTGASAVYLAFAFLLNDMFGRTVLPVGAPLARTPGE
jgi:succinate-acetate transporter protein